MKFSGKVGFWLGSEETKPGKYVSKILEKSYTGDVLRNQRRFQPVESQQNDDLVINNQISIVSDLYAQNNWHSIKYVLWNNVRFKVTSVDLSNYPRLILEIGGVYNVPTGTVIT